MKKLIPFVFFLLFIANIGCSQSDFYDEEHVSISEKIPYLVSLPSDYKTSSDKKHPVILFLHGGDGSNTKHHPKKYAFGKGIDFPFMVIAPHCNSGCRWSNVNYQELINEVAGKYNIDQSRIYITGYSMGGYGTWSAITRYPELFAAAAPICGGGDASKICVAKNMAVKAFHAKDDPVTPYSGSVKMIEALKKCGANATLKTAITGGHGIWPYIYEDAEIYKWFLSNIKE